MSARDCRCHKYVHSSFLCFCLSLLLAAAGCGGASSPSSSSSTKVLTAIAASPATASLAAGATQQFTATATYNDGSTADVTSAATWTDANAKVAIITSSGMATAVAAGLTTIKASLPSGESGTASITVTLSAGTGTNITTWHVDNNRSGLNASETSLTPTNVAPQTFGKLFSYLVDGYAYAEPLLMSNVTIHGAKHNVLYVATENDSVYAFDADNYGTSAPLWKTSLLNSGEAPIGGPIQPYEGVTSTPVIDPATNTIYVVSVQKSGERRRRLPPECLRHHDRRTQVRQSGRGSGLGDGNEFGCREWHNRTAHLVYSARSPAARERDHLHGLQ